MTSCDLGLKISYELMIASKVKSAMLFLRVHCSLQLDGDVGRGMFGHYITFFGILTLEFLALDNTSAFFNEIWS